MDFINIQNIALELFNSFVYKEKSLNDVKRYNELLEFGIIIPEIEKIDEESYDAIKKSIHKNFIGRQDISKSFFRYFEDQPENRTLQIIYQILHYSSTYGTNFKGEAFIPNDLKEDFDKFVEIKRVINLMDIKTFENELKEIIYNQKTFPKHLVIHISKYLYENNINVDVNKIVSRELKREYVKQVGNLRKVKNVEERLKLFLEMIISNELIDFTGVTKKDYEIELGMIKSCKESYLKLMNESFHEVELATIFNRYKNIFMALKTVDKTLIRKINRISKLSKKHHKPYKMPYYLTITYNSEFRENEIIKLDTPYVVKIANALKKRLIDDHNFIYTIRNGKVWVKKANIKLPKEEILRRYNFVLSVLNERINNNLKDLDLTLTNELNIDLALPESFKKVIGNIPFFSKIKVGEIIGIFWKGSYVDLDLRAYSPSFRISWNSNLRNENVIHSGDITSAPNGAVEAIFIKNLNEILIVSVHGFKTIGTADFIFFLKENADVTIENYKEYHSLSSINDIYFQNKLKIDNDQQITLGIVYEGDFYFGNFKFPNMNSIDNNDFDLHKAFESKIKGTVRISDLSLDYEGTNKKDVKDLSLDDLRKIFK